MNAAGYAESEELHVSVPGEAATQLEIRLVPGAIVSGEVRHPDGTPALGARVTPELDMRTYIEAAMGQRDVPHALTDEQGAFRIGGLPAGDIALSAQATDFAPSQPLVLSLEPGLELRDQVLQLRIGARITGEVFGADGDPAAGVQVIVQTAQGRGQQIQNTDSDGKFSVEHLAPDSYQVIAMLADLGAGNLSDENANAMAFLESMKMEVVSVEDEQQVHVLLGEPPAFPVELTGRVLVDGNPVAGAFVQLIPIEGAGISAMRMTTADSQGRYSATLDEPGSLLANVSLLGAGGMARQSVELHIEVPRDSTARIDLELPVATISGQVDGPDGRPLAGARITMSADGAMQSGTFLGGHYAETTTDADGKYQVEWIPEGSYAVAAGGAVMGGAFGKDEFLHGREVRPGVAVKEGEHVRGVDFKLSAPGGIAGSICDASGTPRAGITDFVRDSNGALLERLSMVATDAAGRFEYPGLRPGDYTVVARGAGLASDVAARVSVAGGQSTQVKLTVSQGTTLIVKLVDEDGSRVQGLVHVADEDGVQVNGMLSMADLMAALSGGENSPLAEEHVGPLGPGRYKITARSADGLEGTKLVRLRPGDEDERVTLKLRRP